LVHPGIPVVRATDMFRRWVEGRKDQRMPLVGSMELTARCNLKCKHCYINLPANDADARKTELSKGQWCRLIDQIADAGCLFLLMTGGEVFLRDDFVEIHKYASSKGLLIVIFTNGTLLNSRTVELLADSPPRSIEITLNGRTQQTYELVTGVPGSYRRCMQGIDLLLKAGLRLELKTTVSILNMHEVHLLKAYAQSLGLEFRFDIALNARLDGGRQPVALRVPPEDAASLECGDPQRADELRCTFGGFMGLRPRGEFLYECGAARNLFHIDSCGVMTPCLMSRSTGYDLAHLTFDEAWAEFVPTVLSRRRHGSTECDDCNLAVVCEQCPGWAELENGDAEHRVKYLCDMAWSRLAVIGSHESSGQKPL
jgi:radical SAM protein with 4Fe4S-binding SPASM domain